MLHEPDKPAALLIHGSDPFLQRMSVRLKLNEFIAEQLERRGVGVHNKLEPPIFPLIRPNIEQLLCSLDDEFAPWTGVLDDIRSLQEGRPFQLVVVVTVAEDDLPKQETNMSGVSALYRAGACRQALIRAVGFPPSRVAAVMVFRETGDVLPIMELDHADRPSLVDQRPAIAP